MSSKFNFWFVISFLSMHVYGQSYRSAENPMYWKNKMPFSDYWQQDIHYRISASLDEKNEIIIGQESINYYNNSKDTLRELYFNLYQNAFIDGSYLSNLTEANGIKPKYGKWEKEKKGNEITSLQVNGIEQVTEIDGSIMKVHLRKPILPSDSAGIQVVFKTYYSNGGEVRRRMKSFSVQGEKHFNGAHWYPRLAVYDRKFGWCTDQHLNREFYGDFGTYQVELNMPANYVVEATGTLMNTKEVLPDTLRRRLDLKNYWSNKWDDKITFKIPIEKGARKVWKYNAINVHDFAWVAGPSYRIMDSTIAGIKVVALVHEPHASGWKNSVNYTHRVMQIYNRDFGQYGYPKMVVADCQDGMEYPMLTMDGGADPDYRGLLAHEVGHNWFYGMVNNNETYRALLDEGFTQFLTSWAMENLDGKYKPISPIKNKYVAHFSDSVATREEKVYWSYMSDAMRNNDAMINTHSDGFHGALGQGGGYRHVYSKTATMLYNLQYVLGDELFQNAMKHYFDQWSYCHPYVEDFRNSMIQYSKVDLNWFFDQWLETTKNIDYNIVGVEQTIEDSVYNLVLERKGLMQMPLDFTVYTKNGATQDFHIPNTWFVKKTNAKVLPRWIGWDEKLNTRYEVKIKVNGDLKNIKIDPTGRMADINLLDNSLKTPRVIRLDSKINTFPNRFQYVMNIRPDIWYNNYDGVKLGVHLDGGYLRTKHLMNLDLWVNTKVGKGAIRPIAYAGAPYYVLNFRHNYRNTMDVWFKNGTWGYDARFLDGLWLASAFIDKKVTDKFSLNLAYKWMKRNNISDLEYLHFKSDWENTQANGSLIFTANYQNGKSKWNENLTVQVRTSAFTASTSYSYLSANYLFNTKVKNFDIRTRTYGRLGGGSLTPSESKLYAAQGSPEEMQENKYMRSVTAFPSTLYGLYDGNSDNLHFGGGLNLRGYVGRDLLVFDKVENKFVEMYSANSGGSVNIEVGFDKYFNVQAPKIKEYIGFNTYLFTDLGMIGNVQLKKGGNTVFSLPLYDAGLGAALTFKKFWVLQNIKPLTIRVDFPFLLSEPDARDNGKHWAGRWVIGINRAF